MSLAEARRLGYEVRVERRRPDGYPFPWGFSIGLPDGDAYDFIGMPNQCATRRAATMRALVRVKWLADGTFGRRYR